MFPITKSYQRRFRTEGSAYYVTLQRIIDGNTKRIVSECRHTSTATSAREGLALPSTSTALWVCWRARSRAPRLSLEPCGVAPHF